MNKFDINLKDYREWSNEQNLSSFDLQFSLLDQESQPQSDINMNTLTAEQWSEVPGIGPTLAQRLVESGPYNSIDDIREVKGISEKVFQNVQSFLTS